MKQLSRNSCKLQVNVDQQLIILASLLDFLQIGFNIAIIITQISILVVYSKYLVILIYSKYLVGLASKQLSKTSSSNTNSRYTNQYSAVAYCIRFGQANKPRVYRVPYIVEVSRQRKLYRYGISSIEVGNTNQNFILIYIYIPINNTVVLST